MSPPPSTIYSIPFTKMVGAGNDFLIVDAVHQRLGSFGKAWSRLARTMCDRRDGVGADGLLVLEASRHADCRMRVLNPDGSEAEMCGNGARCVAHYVAAAGRKPQVVIESLAGLVSATVREDRVAIRLTDPTEIRLGRTLTVGGRRLRMGSVNTGVPHAVIPVQDLEAVDVQRLGRLLRMHRAFAPRGTNVDFIQADRRQQHHLRIRTYERGVEGETLACGTGVTAAAVIHALETANGVVVGRAGKGRTTRRIQVEARSGDILTVSFRVLGPRGSPRVADVVLEGPVRRICQGTFQRR